MTQPNLVKQSKNTVDPKITKLHNWSTVELVNNAKSRKTYEAPSLFVPMIMDKQGKLPHSKLCAFKDATLMAHLNRVAILPGDYNAYNRLDTVSRREWLERARYQVGCIYLIRCILLFSCDGTLCLHYHYLEIGQADEDVLELAKLNQLNKEDESAKQTKVVSTKAKTQAEKRLRDVMVALLSQLVS